jgi:hypothetical protein
MFDIAKICSSVVLVKEGHVVLHGSTPQGIAAYEAALSNQNSSERESSAVMDSRLSSFKLLEFKCQRNEDKVHADLNLRLSFVAKEAIHGLKARISLCDSAGTPLAEWDSSTTNLPLSIKAGSNKLSLHVSSIAMKSGLYNCVLVVSTSDNRKYVLVVDRNLLAVVDSPFTFGAPNRLLHGACAITPSN